MQFFAVYVTLRLSGTRPFFSKTIRTGVTFTFPLVRRNISNLEFCTYPLRHVSDYDCGNGLADILCLQTIVSLNTKHILGVLFDCSLNNVDVIEYTVCHQHDVKRRSYAFLLVGIEARNDAILSEKRLVNCQLTEALSSPVIALPLRCRVGECG